VLEFEEIERRCAQPVGRLERFVRLLEPVTPDALRQRAAEAASVTRRHFGKAVRLFAPLYVSNECINSCQYCGFSRENRILRATLNVNEVVTEATHLAGQGFRNILLVAGEHPKFVSDGYLAECIARVSEIVPAVGIEVAPMDVPDYAKMVSAGAEGLVVYQETYDPEAYATLHTAGPKKDFASRLQCPERGYSAGFRRIGVGALFGLSEWRAEAIRLAAHLDYLLQTCWKTHLTVSMPRLRPAAGSFEPAFPLSDREFIQLTCAFRIAFPHIGIVLSTREPAPLRDALATLGVTLMSAGSHTEPGGYTGQGSTHLSLRGKPVEASDSTGPAEPQFCISDGRPVEEVVARLAELGLESVWKDWDRGILAREPAASGR